ANAVPADGAPVAPERTALPAQLPARKLARLPLLGHRTRAVTRWAHHGRRTAPLGCRSPPWALPHIHDRCAGLGSARAHFGRTARSEADRRPRRRVSHPCRSRAARWLGTRVRPS